MQYVDRDKHRPSYLSKPKSGKSTFQGKTSRYPDHERIGQLAITKRDDVAGALKKESIDPEEIASIIRGEHSRAAYNQLIHSSLDMDRMDYMVRDSLGTGVPYGRIDLHYLLSNLDVTDDGQVVVSYKAAAAAEHFVVARYFMYKTVYLHKTIFGFEALLRHILFLLREHGDIPKSGEEIEAMVLSDEFLEFHDGWVDDRIKDYSHKTKPKEIVSLCKALRLRQPPRLVHEVSVLTKQEGPPAEYALFTKDRADRIAQLESEFKIPKAQWIWEDPKDIKFEALGPFVPLSQASDVDPDEAAELILRQAARFSKAGPIYTTSDTMQAIIAASISPRRFACLSHGNVSGKRREDRSCAGFPRFCRRRRRGHRAGWRRDRRESARRRPP